MKKASQAKSITEEILKKHLSEFAERFDIIDQRFNIIHQRFDGVDQRFDAVDGKFDQLDAKIDDVEEHLNAKIGGVAIGVIKLTERVDHIEEMMATKRDFGVLMERMDFYAGQYRNIDQEQLAQAKHIKDHRETLQQHEVRLSDLESA